MMIIGIVVWKLWARVNGMTVAVDAVVEWRRVRGANFGFEFEPIPVGPARRQRPRREGGEQPQAQQQGRLINITFLSKCSQ